MAKPIVDGVEGRVAGQAVVLRLNVQDGAGRSLAARYAVTAVPTFLVFRGGSDPVARYVGRPDGERLVDALLRP